MDGKPWWGWEISTEDRKSSAGWEIIEKGSCCGMKNQLMARLAEAGAGRMITMGTDPLEPCLPQTSPTLTKHHGQYSSRLPLLLVLLPSG